LAHLVHIWNSPPHFAYSLHFTYVYGRLHMKVSPLSGVLPSHR